jgi:D-glycero-D-manno-heptose 1,7-bisphosphate phosphatase
MKLVILDRDGTINVDSDEFIKTPEEWVPLPGALEAIAKLNHAGWHVAVASNQSGLGRGLFDVASLNAIHAKMHKLVASMGGRIDAVFYCPHGPEEGCQCRKPAPGLFEQIGERFGVDLRTTHVVGDTARDLQAGVAVGCVPHLVLTGKAEALRGAAGQGQPLPDTYPAHTQVHQDLGAFADWLVTRAPAPRATT